MAAEPASPANAAEMRAYYAQRAPAYERVYAKPERQADLRTLEAALPGLFAGRCVLEIACGTGWWTPHGAARAAAWLATDINPETLAIARSKALPACVRLAEADAWALEGLPDDERFDAAFAGFWWSHVPLARLPAWLDLLHARLAPGARVVFIDNVYVEGSSTPIARRDAEGNQWQQRPLDDGSVHEVLKNFPSREDALQLLGSRALDATWTALPHYWMLSYALA
ncbi:Class I SAM-dependent methyltransferase [Rubrivivax sp. A210]|uniref:methyltransferase domain-containing protein n=1 Tax=Rubrivivax sp. A210 TaxID=2772301 RepID=UPI0019B1C222|nr:class I SAM-dependent methyltransferase [Rubrivivax sp. A210]CAD5370313.1 Class I SAM-dependent methyltransferase [Rubrivivax sp. A210]